LGREAAQNRRFPVRPHFDCIGAALCVCTTAAWLDNPPPPGLKVAPRPGLRLLSPGRGADRGRAVLRSWPWIKPYQFIVLGAVAVAKPNRFIWFGDIHGPKPYKFIA
jgi:hypothetical protein